MYERVSTEEQVKHGISIEAQSAALHKWAADNGHEIVGEYTDNGVSARKMPSKRPELQRLLGDIPGRKIELVAFVRLDRWTRNVKGYYQVQDVLDKYKVSWQAIQEDYETVTASGRMKVNIMLSVAENEADRTSERIKAIHAHKVNLGEPITCSQPLGLKIDGKKLVPDDNADAARAAFAEFVKTANVTKTMDFLRTYYSISLPNLSVRNLLRNRLYIGEYRGNKEYCEPIIEKAVFDEAQRLLSMRGVKAPHTGRVYLFSGLVFCGECGHRMVGYKARTLSYRCNNHFELKRCNHRGCYQEKAIEAYLLDHIVELAEGQAAQYHAAQKRKPEVDRATVKRKLERLKDLYVEGDIDKDKYRIERDKLTPLLDAPPPPKQSVLEILGDNFEDRYAKMTALQKQQTWRKVIDHITISSDRELHIFLR